MTTKHSARKLHRLLDALESAHKQDVHDYASGHLNESRLWKACELSKRKPWSAAQKEAPTKLQRSKLFQSSTDDDDQIKVMNNVLYDFSVGTTGSLPPSKIVANKRVVSTKMKGSKRPDCSSAGSLYSQLEDDGVLVEELQPQELMMPTPRDVAKATPRSGTSSGDINDKRSELQSKPWSVPLRHSFISTLQAGITKHDQYINLKSFEKTIIRKQDTMEQNVLSGIKAVCHLESKLNEQLDTLNVTGTGPNFHRLQIHSNLFEDLIDETPTLGYILKCVKEEYDNYLSYLLDNQTSQHRVIQDQVDQMSLRGTSKPKELSNAKEKVDHLEEEARYLLETNERLRQDVEIEAEMTASFTEPESSHRMTVTYHDELHIELADELQHVKALILEKLDNLTALRAKLRDKFVPSTVCTHLEQCIKETEVEVQKLLKQSEYFERSIADMDHDLKEAIRDADTSEKDARRIWRKVNSMRGFRNDRSLKGQMGTADSDDDDESKWSWYIS